VPKVFISYRREDAGAQVEQIHARLRERFGPGSVFLDVRSIPLGVDFRDYLVQALSRCDALLAVIGNLWLSVERNGRRRIDEPVDFVRLEIETGLGRGIPVIPVLIVPAQMPAEGELPDALKPLAFRNGCFLDPGGPFLEAVERLADEVTRLAALGIEPPFSARYDLFFQQQPAGGDILIKDRLVIGRDPDCDIVLPGGGVARKHAEIVREKGGYALIDLGSRNGTSVNNQRVQGRVSLWDGDRIQITDFMFKYQWSPHTATNSG
jgi:hypothetical protein